MVGMDDHSSTAADSTSIHYDDQNGYANGYDTYTHGNGTLQQS